MIKQEVKPGLEGVVVTDTFISLVDGEKGELIYRGYSAKDLAIKNEFEEVCYLLWYGNLPNKIEAENLKSQMSKERELPLYVKDIIKNLPLEMDMMSVLRTCISALGTSEYSYKPTIEQAIVITSKIPTILAYRFRYINNLPEIAPLNELSHVANYLYMLKGSNPKEAHVRTLNAYFILTMEHGMNASTFTARVISSTESEIISAITGAIGAMKGPLHGGAPSEVMDLLERIETKENAEKWLRNELENGNKIMGFGHRVYKTSDPRAVALRMITEEFSNQDQWLDLAYYVEQEAIRLLELYKPGRRLYTNVEFYAAAILRAVDMPIELFTPTFTASRVAGWTANVIEQAANNRIYRPQSNYIGPRL